MRVELIPDGPSRRVQEPTATFALDVRRGLDGREQKRLPSRYLYDALGSALFEAICALPEYGVSRAGERLLVRHAAELRAHLDGPLHVIELGGGSGNKLRLLLDGLLRERRSGAASVESVSAVDVSTAALEATRIALARFPGLHVETYAMAFRWGLRQVTARRASGERCLVVFLGSNLGNYEPDESAAFLRDVHAALQPGDALLLGLDLVKERAVMHAAYDDALGVTAAFDKNLLARMNRELAARFDLDHFEHEARWNARHRRIEMHLRSTRKQIVPIPEAGISAAFGRGETIWTESSHKYELADVPALGRAAGFEPVTKWVDAEWPFVHALFART
jgi:L-histidine Nalpha-methyltransferase